MATIDVFNLKREKVGTLNLADEVFATEVNEGLFYEIVKAQLASRRQGTASAKERSAVSGSTKKLYKQKGTGRARQGSNTSPLMPGGGRAFGPKPRDYRLEMPRQQRRAALVSALSLKATQDAVAVIEAIAVDAAPKTAKVAGVLKTAGLAGQRTLIVVDQQNETVWKSVRNLANVRTLLAHQLNPYDLMNCERLLLTKDGLARVTEVFAR